MSLGHKKLSIGQVTQCATIPYIFGCFSGLTAGIGCRYIEWQVGWIVQSRGEVFYLLVCLCHSADEQEEGEEEEEEDERDPAFIERDSQQQGTEDDADLHRWIDALHPADAQTPFVTPYFRLALAVDRPLEFK